MVHAHKFTLKSVKCEHSQRAGFSINSRYVTHTHTHTPNIPPFFSTFNISSKYLDVKWFCLYQNMRIQTFAGPNESGGCKRKKTEYLYETASSRVLKVLKEFVSLWFIYQMGEKKLHLLTKLCTRKERIRFFARSFSFHWKVHRETVPMANACGKRARINQNNQSHSTIINVNQQHCTIFIQHEFTCAPSTGWCYGFLFGFLF